MCWRFRSGGRESKCQEARNKCRLPALTREGGWGLQVPGQRWKQLWDWVQMSDILCALLGPKQTSQSILCAWSDSLDRGFSELEATLYVKWFSLAPGWQGWELAQPLSLQGGQGCCSAATVGPGTGYHKGTICLLQSEWNSQREPLQRDEFCPRQLLGWKPFCA